MRVLARALREQPRFVQRRAPYLFVYGHWRVAWLGAELIDTLLQGSTILATNDPTFHLWENQPWNHDPGANITRFNRLYARTVTLPYIAHSLARLPVRLGEAEQPEQWRPLALMFHGDFHRRDYGVLVWDVFRVQL